MNRSELKEYVQKFRLNEMNSLYVHVYMFIFLNMLFRNFLNEEN